LEKRVPARVGDDRVAGRARVEELRERTAKVVVIVALAAVLVSWNMVIPT
jgi:hypothetical protein